MDTKSQELFYKIFHGAKTVFFHKATIWVNLRWIRRNNHAWQQVRLPLLVLRIADSGLHNERQAAKYNIPKSVRWLGKISSKCLHFIRYPLKSCRICAYLSRIVQSFVQCNKNKNTQSYTTGAIFARKGLEYYGFCFYDIRTSVTWHPENNMDG